MLLKEWKRKAKDIYNHYVDLLEEEGYSDNSLDYGDSHIVWDDYNYESDSIQCCIARIEKSGKEWYLDVETLIVMSSLKTLLLLPSYENCTDYEDL